MCRFNPSDVHVLLYNCVEYTVLIGAVRLISVDQFFRKSTFLLRGWLLLLLQELNQQADEILRGARGSVVTFLQTLRVAQFSAAGDQSARPSN